MRVALYQCPPLPLDVAGNLQRLQNIAMEASDADLLVLPEMYLSGYNIGPEAVGALAEAQDGPSAEHIAAIARAAGTAIVYGYAERAEDGQIYNAIQLIDAQGQRLCNYRKTHLFGDLDRSMFSAGADQFPLVELNGWKLGFLICYDIEFPENARRLALGGAELILVPTANMRPYEFVAAVVGVGHVALVFKGPGAHGHFGNEDEIHYCGLSSIAAPDGTLSAQAGLDEALISGVLDRQLMLDSRAINRYFVDRRPELYDDLNKR